MLEDNQVPEHPPWLLSKPSIILTELRKVGTHLLEYQRLHIEIQDQFEDHISTYTDSSKDQNRVAATAVCQQNKCCVCLPDQSYIFTAEAQALLLALECIDVSNYTKYVVYSVSFSCLQAVAMLKLDHPFVAKIIYKMDQLAPDGYNIHLCWMPGHAGIRGNGRGGRAAKKALD